MRQYNSSCLGEKYQNSQLGQKADFIIMLNEREREI